MIDMFTELRNVHAGFPVRFNNHPPGLLIFVCHDVDVCLAHASGSPVPQASSSNFLKQLHEYAGYNSL